MPKESDQVESRLSQYLDGVAGARDALEGERANEETRLQNFVDNFRAMRSSKIRPSLEKAAEPFRSRNLPAVIREGDLPTGGSIALEVTPEPSRGGTLTYSTTDSLTVQVSRSFTHFAGPAEEVANLPLNEVTLETIEYQAAEFLAAIVPR